MSFLQRRTFRCQRCDEPVQIDPRRNSSICPRCEMEEMLPEQPSPSEWYEAARRQHHEAHREVRAQIERQMLWGESPLTQLLQQTGRSPSNEVFDDPEDAPVRKLPTIADNIPTHMFKEYNMLPESVRTKIEQGMMNVAVTYSDAMAEHKNAAIHQRRAVIEHLAVAIAEANKTTVVKTSDEGGGTKEVHRLFTYTQEEWLRILIDTFYAGFDYAKDKMEKKDGTK